MTNTFNAPLENDTSFWRVILWRVMTSDKITLTKLSSIQHKN